MFADMNSVIGFITCYIYIFAVVILRQCVALIVIRHSGSGKCNDRKIIPSIKINLSPFHTCVSNRIVSSRAMKLNAARKNNIAIT